MKNILCFPLLFSRKCKKYGINHIQNIKNKIEERLSQIPSLERKPCVFLDADALKLGMLGNRTIIAQIFVK